MERGRCRRLIARNVAGQAKARPAIARLSASGRRPAVLLVRDVMTIGVPTCRDDEPCSTVAARLTDAAPVVVALDEDGMACGWATRAQLLAKPSHTVAEVMDEDIPTVPPDIPAEAAWQLMSDGGLDVLFLMHTWPGEPRPAAMVMRDVLLRKVRESL